MRKLIIPAVATGLLLTGCGPANNHPATEFTSSAQGTTAPATIDAIRAQTGKPCHARHVNEADPEAWEPDLACTPGKANPAVTIGQLCPVAHTRQWRVDISKQKKEALARYDYIDSQGNHPQTLASTEGDHAVALVDGGDPTAPENIWAEPELGHPNEKDKVEVAAHAALCRGAMTLPQVQAGLATDWYGLGQRLGVIKTD